MFDYTVGSGDETANLEVTSVNLPTGNDDTERRRRPQKKFTAAINALTGLQVGPVYITAIASSLSGDLAQGQTNPSDTDHEPGE